ncbi:hypothetical protein [Pseudomonas aeruginosa]|uniref:hypothetical protein n=2 Tax=Pseudomonas aeruginosa TaxID=287 RepID=UPI0008FB6D38|nr:hypothetical protein [Pseudomonas aeruginosa]EJB8388764.1 hypothetical protein [Pseudomonas aeruginosa]EKW2907433.1 hypothetical protein [Pseudomonas aeruginosa]ELK4793224.1 hypothetical protein [Pseudomonas aeruginosa]ELK4870997.1 hypothetical protein [Pseudomonas aeruginosa]EMC2533231.1 hypothetical protein [Pseudomonas aeruginosa]
MLSKSEINKAKRFIEEFSWLMESYGKIDLRSIAKLIDEIPSEPAAIQLANRAKEKTQPKTNFLTGILPSLFMDTQLFKSNEEISDFASSILGVTVLRAHKKSKFEIIGHIVCETISLDDKGIDRVIKALSILSSDESRRKQIASKKNEGFFGWNDVIQELSGD